MSKQNLEAAIARQSVESSQISSVGYDPATETLEVQFRSGGVYRYSGVSEDIAKEMLSAKSVGSFFYRNIKPSPTQYPFAKVSA